MHGVLCDVVASWQNNSLLLQKYFLGKFKQFNFFTRFIYEQPDDKNVNIFEDESTL
jgi:hypothetical protein